MGERLERSNLCHEEPNQAFGGEVLGPDVRYCIYKCWASEHLPQIQFPGLSISLALTPRAPTGTSEVLLAPDRAHWFLPPCAGTARHGLWEPAWGTCPGYKITQLFQSSLTQAVLARLALSAGLQRQCWHMTGGARISVNGACIRSLHITLSELPSLPVRVTARTGKVSSHKKRHPEPRDSSLVI